MKRGPISAHLDEPELIAFLQAKAPRGRRLEVQVHLAICAECKSRFDRLAGDSCTQASASQVGRELPEILAAIRCHEARRLRTDDLQAAKARAAKQVGPYLGALATAKLLEDVSPDCRNLMSELQPILSLFLGRRAGSRLSTRVVEASVVRF